MASLLCFNIIFSHLFVHNDFPYFKKRYEGKYEGAKNPYKSCKIYLSCLSSVKT